MSGCVAFRGLLVFSAKPETATVHSASGMHSHSDAPLLVPPVSSQHALGCGALQGGEAPCFLKVTCSDFL